MFISNASLLRFARLAFPLISRKTRLISVDTQARTIVFPVIEDVSVTAVWHFNDPNALNIKHDYVDIGKFLTRTKTGSRARTFRWGYSEKLDTLVVADAYDLPGYAKAIDESQITA